MKTIISSQLQRTVSGTTKKALRRPKLNVQHVTIIFTSGVIFQFQLNTHGKTEKNGHQIITYIILW